MGLCFFSLSGLLNFGYTNSLMMLHSETTAGEVFTVVGDFLNRYFNEGVSVHLLFGT